MITEGNNIILDHDFNALKVDISDRILTITLNRPEKLNTFDEGMKEDFHHHDYSNASIVRIANICSQLSEFYMFRF